MAQTLPDFDELNNIRSTFENEIYGSVQDRKFDRKRLEDDIFELLTMSYVYGLEKAGLDLDRDIPVNRDRMRKAVYEKTAGKDFVERLNEHLDAADERIAEDQQVSADITTAEQLVNELSVLAETEAGRVLNRAIIEAAEDYQRQHPDEVVYKTWVAVMDERTRDTHAELDGVTIPLDAEFYTFRGNHALYPHQFKEPEETVNCRCLCSLSTRLKNETQST